MPYYQLLEQVTSSCHMYHYKTKYGQVHRHNKIDFNKNCPLTQFLLHGGFLLRLQRLVSMALFQLSLSVTIMSLQTLCKNIILKNLPKFFKYITMNMAIMSNTSSSLIRGTWKTPIDDIVVKTTADAFKFQNVLILKLHFTTMKKYTYQA